VASLPSRYAEPADEVTWRKAAGILAVGFRPVGLLVARPVKVHDRRWVTSWLVANRRDAAGWWANSSIAGGARQCNGDSLILKPLALEIPWLASVGC
jgi:hypothetical protein